MSHDRQLAEVDAAAEATGQQKPLPEPRPSPQAHSPSPQPQPSPFLAAPPAGKLQTQARLFAGYQGAGSGV